MESEQERQVRKERARETEKDMLTRARALWCPKTSLDPY